MKLGRILASFILVVITIANFFSIEAAEKTADFVVVIDAGHGGNDTGAIDNGVKEKDINLAVAKRLQEDLQKKIKGIKVIMTRSNDTFVSLQGRADIANKNKADLFISIHTNSVDTKNPNRTGVEGASVYALGLHKDKDNLNVAKRENSVIELEKDHEEKYSGFDPSKDESYIIFEMAQKKNLEQSLRFANFAQKQLVSHAGRKDRGVKQAGFWVLWATSMPAVLVELDFICNPRSANFMSSTEGEKKMAAALCNAVEQYYENFKNNNVKRTSLASSKNKSGKTKVSKGSKINNKKEEIDPSDVAVISKYVNASSDDVVASLPAVKKNGRNDTPPSTSQQRRVTTARKRRSASSRLASEKRDVSTSTILVKSENSYLASNNVKKPEPESKTLNTEKQETAKERKKRLAMEKKQKEKERKELAALKKKQEKEEAERRKREEKMNLAQNKDNNKNKSSKENKSARKSVVSDKGNVTSTSSTEYGAGYANVKKRRSLNSKKNN